MAWRKRFCLFGTPKTDESQQEDAGHAGQTPQGHAHGSLTTAHVRTAPDTTCGTAVHKRARVRGGVGRLANACESATATWQLTGSVNQSLQRLTASIEVPLRVVRLSVAPLSVAMMSAAPVSLVHSREHNAEGAVERDAVVGSALPSEVGGG